MKISVVMPCHNNEAVLEHALDSVADQAYAVHELIVVDDASSDDSAERAGRHPAVTRVISTNHRNAAAARNEGISRATGDWIAFLDADNRWHTDHLSRAAALLAGGSDCLFVAPPLASGLPTERTEKREGCPATDDVTGLTQDAFVQWRLRRGWGFPTSGLVASRHRLTEIGGFNVEQQRRHDFELVMRLIVGHTWCATPWATWWSRPPRGNDISADGPRCAYFALRALSLNRGAYQGKTYDRLLSQQARRAWAMALRSGNTELLRDATTLAQPYLPLFDRTVFGLLSRIPKPLRHRLGY